MKKSMIALVVVMAVALTAFAMPVFAGEVDQFGYNPERNRVVPDKSYLPMYPLWVYESGRSSSQPLILKGELNKHYYHHVNNFLEKPAPCQAFLLSYKYCTSLSCYVSIEKDERFLRGLKL